MHEYLIFCEKNGKSDVKDYVVDNEKCHTAWWLVTTGYIVFHIVTITNHFNIGSLKTVVVLVNETRESRVNIYDLLDSGEQGAPLRTEAISSDRIIEIVPSTIIQGHHGVPLCAYLLVLL